ncbi:MAG: leucine-rich repeat domain-containing protein [Treponema sp.]|nr:leucine-rich repeat domain-containing protein [Treponema sp.]
MSILENGLTLSDDRTKVISFSQAAGFESIDIPDSVVDLSPSLFADCKLLKRIKLPKNVRVIPDYLFENCSSLEKIIMPNVVDAFGRGAFSGCYSLATVPFRAGITELPDEVFSYCTSLTSLIIPDTVKIIKSGAVASCTSLEAVVLPAQLEVLETGAFAGCTSLRHIRISDENRFFYVNEYNGCLYKKQDSGDDELILSPVDFDKTPAKIIKVTEFDEADEDEVFVGLNSEETAFIGTDIVEDETVIDDAFEYEETEEDAEELDEEKAVAATEREDLVVHTEDEELEENAMSMEIETDFSPVMQEEVNALFAGRESANGYVAPQKSELDMLTAEMDILSQNTPITMSVAERIADGKDYVEASVTTEGDTLLDRVADAAEKFECIKLSQTEKKAAWNSLYVFAENLVFTNDEAGHFSEALINCCRRIAHIHNYVQIFFYYGLPLENEEFAQFFRDFIEERNTIYACSAPSTSELSANARRFASIAGISLEKSALELSNELAANTNAACIKMILQDDYTS